MLALKGGENMISKRKGRRAQGVSLAAGIRVGF